MIIPSAALKRGPLVTRQGYKLTAEDRLEITALPARFEWAFCSNDFEALADVVTEDIEIDHGLGRHAKGRVEMGKLNVPFFGLRHQLTNQLISINANGEAALVSYLNAPQVRSEKPVDAALPAIYASCVVTDEVRLGNDGLWRSSHRVFDQLKLGDYLLLEPSETQKLAVANFRD